MNAKDFVKQQREKVTASQITNYAIDYFNRNGAHVWRQNNIAVKGRTFNGKKGISDIIGISVKGLFIACEVKKPGDSFKESQHKFLSQVHYLGGFAYVAYVNATAEIVIADYIQVKHVKVF